MRRSAAIALLFTIASCTKPSAEAGPPDGALVHRAAEPGDAPPLPALGGPFSELSLGADAAARSSREGEVFVDPVTPPPSLVSAARVLVSLRPQLRACYIRGLQSDPAQWGNIVISVTVAGDGGVSHAEATKNTGLSANVAHCAEKVLADASFVRSSADNSPATLVVPLRFELSPDDAGIKDPATWAIQVVPSTVSLAHQEETRVIITLTSYARAPLSPHRDPLDFWVDGKSSPSLGLAFGNGGRTTSWTLLPPGETARDERVGVRFLETTGDHRLSIARDGREVATTIVHVTP